MDHDSGKYLHLLAEAMKFGHQSRSRYVGDPIYNVPLEELLSKDFCKIKKSYYQS